MNNTIILHHRFHCCSSFGNGKGFGDCPGDGKGFGYDFGSGDGCGL